jgi:hypothetical protein
LNKRCAGEGSSEEVVSVGDKGRSQLTRTEGKTFALAVGDTYKIRVTFPQVRFVQGLDLRACDQPLFDRWFATALLGLACNCRPP